MKVLKKCVKSSSPEGFDFFRDIIENSLPQVQGEKWYRYLKKQLYKRQRRSVYDFLFEPVVLAWYRFRIKISLRNRTKNRYRRKLHDYPIRIRDNNVNFYKFFDNNAQQAFAAQMQKEKQNAINAKRKD